MEIVYVGNEKFVEYNGRLHTITDESKGAICQAEWARKIISNKAVIWPNGKNSHEVAGDILDKNEDILIDYIRITA